MTTNALAPCASVDTLEQLLDGALVESEASVLRAHLVGCRECQAALERLSDHTALRQWKFACGPLAPCIPNSTEMCRLLDDLRALPSSALPTTVEAGFSNAAPGSRARQDVPSELGPYRVLAELGRGGMGVVFKAHDPALERVVAVKVLHAHRTDASGRERFVREARAAAALKHDHIVAVHAVANPPDGPPYLVMEYVAGPTLHARIKAERRLDPREAALICCQVADGLTAAHRAGLIHRDIKPANVLLESRGESEDAATRGRGDAASKVTTVPASPRPRVAASQLRAKLTDFGLVRAAERTNPQTQEGVIAGTPEYMSPEQIRTPEAIDARSDVCSLGVTLYEALTGSVPFRGAPTMVLEQILNDEPAPPRRLSDSIPRDLETICLKAMAKEPLRRYQSAVELRDDLQRWLDGEPIQARPVGRVERAWRWCKRKPALAGVTAALAIVFLTGFSGVTWQWLRADRNFDLAEQRRRKAHEAINEYFVRVSEDKLLNRPGLQELRKDLLDSALRYFQDFLDEWGDDPAMRADVAATYLNVAQAKERLGLNAEARAAFAEALARYEALAAANPEDSDLRARLARAYSDFGQMHAEANAFAEALPALNQARVTQDELVQHYPDEPQYASDLATILHRLGNVQYKQGARKSAIEVWDRVRLMQEKLVREHAKEHKYRISLAMTCHNLAQGHKDEGDATAALRFLEQARDLRAGLVRIQSTSPDYQAELSDSHQSIGMFHADRREGAAAAQAFAQACELLERLVHDNPTVTSFQWNLGRIYYNQALLHRDEGRHLEAIRLHRAAQPIFARLSRVNPGFPTYRAFLANSHFDTGHVQSQIGQQAEALQAFQDAYPVYDQLVRDYPTVVRYKEQLQRCAHNVGNELRRRGRYVEALPSYERSREVSEDLARIDPGNRDFQWLLAFIHQRSAAVYDKLERPADAELATREGFRVITPLVDQHPDKLDYRVILGKCHADRGQRALRAKRYEDAELDFGQALALRLKLVQTHPTAPGVDQEVGMSYHDLGEMHRQAARLVEAVKNFDLARASFAKAVQANPQNLQTQSELGATLDDYALVLAELGRKDEALSLHRQAIECQKTALQKAPDYIDHRERLSRHYQHLAQLLRSLARPTEAADATLERKKLWPQNPAELYRIACDLAACIPLIGSDSSAPTAGQQLDRTRLADEAMTTLGEAVQHGHTDRDLILKEPSLAPLRARADFQELLTKLQSARKP